MPKLRLVHVLVQPVFMLDHGDRLEPIEHPPVAITAAEWAAYSGERFPREVAEWQKQINAEAAQPNRAQRREAAKKRKAD